MDKAQLETLLSINKVDPKGPPEPIQELLRKAGYTEAEIAAALATLGEAPAPAVSAPLVAPQSTVPPEKKRFSVVPRKWLSVHGLLFLLAAYFVALPLGGVALIYLLGLLALIPGVSIFALIGMAFLVVIGSITGIGFIANAYLYVGFHAAAMAMNATSAPYEVVAISCEEGRSISFEAENYAQVRRSYFDAVPIGYNMDRRLNGFMTFTTPDAKASVQTAPLENLRGSFTEAPFGKESAIHLFTYFLPSKAVKERHSLFDEIEGDGGGEALPFVPVASGALDAEDERAFTSCLRAFEEKSGFTIQNQTSLVRGLGGFYFTGSAAPLPRDFDNNFSCANGQSVFLTFTNHIALQQPGGTVQRVGYIDEQNNTHAYSPEEMERLEPGHASTYRWYNEYNDCSEHKRNCPPEIGVNVATPDGGSEWRTVTAESDSYLYWWKIDYMRDAAAKRLQEAGLSVEPLTSFESCRNEGGESIDSAIDALGR